MEIEEFRAKRAELEANISSCVRRPLYLIPRSRMFKKDEEKKEEIYRLAHERFTITGRSVAVLVLNSYWGYCDLDILPPSEYHNVDCIIKTPL